MKRQVADMRVKQLSIFMENKSGRIAEITRILASAGIDIRALSIADTTDFGISRLIVNKPDEASDVCHRAGLMTALTDVIAIQIEDRPGSFSEAMQFLAHAGISVDYMYAFLTPGDEKYACVIISTSDPEHAEELLTKAGVSLLDAEKIYSL